MLNLTEVAEVSVERKRLGVVNVGRQGIRQVINGQWLGYDWEFIGFCNNSIWQQVVAKLEGFSAQWFLNVDIKREKHL